MKRAISIFLVLIMLVSILITSGCRPRVVDTEAALEQLELAIRYLSEDNFEQAISAFHKVLEIDPKNVDAYKGLAIVYVLTDKPEKAKDILRQGIDETEAQAELTLTLSGVYLDIGDVTQSEKLLKELTGTDQIDLSAYRAYVNMLREQNRYDEAVALLLKAAEKDDVPYGIFTTLADIYIRRNDKDNALSAIGQSLLINPQQAQAYRLLMTIFQNEPDTLKVWGAEQDNQLLADVSYIITQYIKGYYTDITVNFAKLSEEAKINAWTIILLSRAHIKLGYNENALRVLNTINTEEINCALLLAEIATMYFAMGETENAALIAKKGIEIDTSIEDNYIVLYRIYSETDTVQSGIWLTKQLLNAPFGYIAAKEIQLAAIQMVEREMEKMVEVMPQPEPEPETEPEPKKELVTLPPLPEDEVFIFPDKYWEGAIIFSKDIYGVLHRGVRFTRQIPIGTPILSPMDGRVNHEAGLKDPVSGESFSVTRVSQNIDSFEGFSFIFVNKETLSSLDGRIKKGESVGTISQNEEILKGFFGDESKTFFLVDVIPHNITNIIDIDTGSLSPKDFLRTLIYVQQPKPEAVVIVVDVALKEIIVNIPDDNLDAAIRTAIDKPTGYITAYDMAHMREFEARGAEIVDLTGIEYAINLRKLDLGGDWGYETLNKISDISALGGLTNLTNLNLSFNQIIDMSALGGLTNLSRLDLSTNQISDLSALNRLTNLTKLRLSFNQISDISALSRLTNLTVLELSKNRISEISALGGLANLTRLILAQNQITDISTLSRLTNLIYLSLDWNQITDINALDRLTNLFSLQLGVNQITNISALDELTNLRNLWLESNQIADISALSGLTNLLFLVLPSNDIVDISALNGLTNLTSLLIGGNPLSPESEALLETLRNRGVDVQ